MASPPGPGPIGVDAANDILRTYFAEWVRALDLTVCDTTERSATLLMPSHPRVHRTGGIVSGQALMALADTAMVIAFCAAAGEFRAMATVDVHTTFMRAASGGNVMAVATVLRTGRTLAFAEARLVTADDRAQVIATASGTYAVPPRA